MKYDIDDDFIDELKKRANRECWCDDKDFSPYDYCAGNMDDAYYGGSDDGEALFARQILDKLNVTYRGKNE